MTDKAWLAGLKVGDQVVVRYLDEAAEPRAIPGTVSEVTKLRIHVTYRLWSGATIFRRSDGAAFPRNHWLPKMWRIEKP